MKPSSLKPTLPLCCTPNSFELLSRQVDLLESTDALLHSVVAVSMHQLGSVDPATVDLKLQAMADTVRARVRGAQPQALLAHLHEHLFEELGFTGNTEDYYNPSNSYLPAVLESRKGLPIILSLIYKVVAERLGMRVWGVGLPGHFIAGVDCGGTTMYVDPFSGGRIVTPEECHEKLMETFGPEIEWSGELLKPVSNRQWLTRILQNLLRSFGSAGRYADVAAVLELEMLLWPAQDHLQRDLALVLARIGLAKPASVWLNAYLRNNPDDPQKTDLEQLLGVLST